MIPAGYMAKRVVQKPEWIKADGVFDIYSVSNCVSDTFTDYINYWKHNGYWFFNSPKLIELVAKENEIDLTGTKIFYYEIFEFQFNAKENKWEQFTPEQSFKTDVLLPKKKELQGYDVVTFNVGTSPECSPLSCNALASIIKINQHCLIETFEDAKSQIEEGHFNNSEPGPYRIFAVFTV